MNIYYKNNVCWTLTDILIRTKSTVGSIIMI